MQSNRFDVLVKGGEVCLPGGRILRADVAVRDGKIAALLAENAPAEADEVVDATGLTVLPGVIDAHLHLGHGADISRPRTREDAQQESAAAATGGVTTMIPYLMAQEPFSDLFDEVLAVTEAGSRIDFGYHFIISTPEQLEQVPGYVAQGVPTFKIFMNNRGGEGARLGLPDIDDAFLYRLAEHCAKHGGMVCPHPENIEVAQYLRQAVLRDDPEGCTGLDGWNRTRPPFVEADAVQRAALLCRVAGAPIHIVHTSSGEALRAALRARADNTRIHIETCPHYLTHDTGWSGGAIGKINPPLREKADTEALWKGIADGTIDTVATDHVHRDASSKQGGIWKASPGCPGMETLLPVMLSEGMHKRGVPLARIVALLCENPARIMGLGHRKGAIAPGFDADLAVVDLKATTRIENANVVSGAGFSIYDGWDLKGRVMHTLVRGRPVLRDCALDEEAVGWGRFQARTLAN